MAQIIATKTSNTLVSDDDMMLPLPDQSNVNNAPPEAGVPHRGHNEAGRTLAVHSLAVLPSYQKEKLGTTLMKAYVQRMVESDVADRISILTYDELTGFYEKLGFEKRGKSDTQYGGGNWTNMVSECLNEACGFGTCGRGLACNDVHVQLSANIFHHRRSWSSTT